MIEENITLGLEHGLHARPAAELVGLTNKFKSTVHLFKDGQKADAKSILDLMILAAEKGSKIVLRIEGEDEEAARVTLIGYLENRLDTQKEG